MTQQSDTQSSRPNLSEDLPWGINYLREDIQDLRAENREFRADTKAEFAAVRQEMQELRKESQGGIARLEGKLDARFHLLLGVTVTLNGMLAALMTALIKL